MRKTFFSARLLSLLLVFAGCGVVGAACPAPAQAAPAPVKAQGAEKYSTRRIAGGTKVRLVVGDKVIPATLNDSRSAKELISRLPYTVSMSKYSHDYCGVMARPLSYDKKDVHNGWLNGDIDFATGGNYFTILYKDEDIKIGRQSEGAEIRKQTSPREASSRQDVSLGQAPLAFRIKLCRRSPSAIRLFPLRRGFVVLLRHRFQPGVFVAAGVALDRKM